MCFKAIFSAKEEVSLVNPMRAEPFPFSTVPYFTLIKHLYSHQCLSFTSSLSFYIHFHHFLPTVLPQQVTQPFHPISFHNITDSFHILLCNSPFVFSFSKTPLIKRTILLLCLFFSNLFCFSLFITYVSF